MRPKFTVLRIGLVLKSLSCLPDQCLAVKINCYKKITRFNAGYLKVLIYCEYQI